MNDAEKLVEALLETDEVDPKSFVGARDAHIEQYKPIIIHGSYGSLNVDPNDGTVYRYDDAPDEEREYGDIVKFDLDELRQWIKANGTPEWAGRADEIVAPGGEFDIVDVGFWTDTGDYVPAEEDHRRMSWGDAEPG
jgi:hypothetical protein